MGSKHAIHGTYDERGIKKYNGMFLDLYVLSFVLSFVLS